MPKLTRTLNLGRRTFILSAGTRHTFPTAVGRTPRTYAWGTALRAYFLGRNLTLAVVVRPSR